MHNKVVLITGASSGIGRETALGLARLGAHVVLVGRDATRSAAAQSDIQARSGNPAVDVLLADLGSQAAVRRLAAEIRARYPRLDVLINNAGGFYARRQLSPDGIEMTFAVNHMSYFLLTNLLLDRLRASAPARIINVASQAHHGAIDMSDLQSTRDYGGFRAYQLSKLANLLFTYELARRLAGSGVTVNAAHPGPVASRFGHNNGVLWRLGLLLAKPFMRSPAQGAATSIYLASAPELAGVSGKYFADCREVRSSRESNDPAAAQRLWEASERLAGTS